MINVYRPFDFGLTSAQEERAAKLHREAIIIDMLFQGPLTTLNYPEFLTAKIENAVAEGLPRAESVNAALAEPSFAAARGELPEFREAWFASGITGGNRQVSVEPHLIARGYGLAQAQFDHLDWMIKALKAEDFRRAKAEGKVAGYVSTQGGPGETVAFIEECYNLGLRMIQLTYNSLTRVGAGCTERTDAGISWYGKQCIEKMNALGIIVDTGHCGRQTTLDACALSTKPVVASHTAVDAICPHDRCKSDEEFKAIAESGGVIGVAMVPFFLNPSGKADMNDFLDHVDYLRKLVGVKHVGIGTDWPLSVPARIMEENFTVLAASLGFRQEHRIDPMETVRGFDTYLDFPNIARGLVARDYRDEDITAILGGNFLRVFEEVCG